MAFVRMRNWTRVDEGRKCSQQQKLYGYRTVRVPASGSNLGGDMIPVCNTFHEIHFLDVQNTQTCIPPPGIVAMLGSMVIRLRPCMIISTPPSPHFVHSGTSFGIENRELYSMVLPLSHKKLGYVGSIISPQPRGWRF